MLVYVHKNETENSSHDHNRAQKKTKTKTKSEVYVQQMGINHGSTQSRLPKASKRAHVYTRVCLWTLVR